MASPCARHSLRCRFHHQSYPRQTQFVALHQCLRWIHLGLWLLFLLYVTTVLLLTDVLMFWFSGVAVRVIVSVAVCLPVHRHADCSRHTRYYSCKYNTLTVACSHVAVSAADDSPHCDAATPVHFLSCLATSVRCVKYGTLRDVVLLDSVQQNSTYPDADYPDRLGTSG